MGFLAFMYNHRWILGSICVVLLICSLFFLCLVADESEFDDPNYTRDVKRKWVLSFSIISVVLALGLGTIVSYSLNISTLKPEYSLDGVPNKVYYQKSIPVKQYVITDGNKQLSKADILKMDDTELGASATAYIKTVKGENLSLSRDNDDSNIEVKTKLTSGKSRVKMQYTKCVKRDKYKNFRLPNYNHLTIIKYQHAQNNQN